jgi:prolipoprotein diacylglyceryltransferase
MKLEKFKKNDNKKMYFFLFLGLIIIVLGGRLSENAYLLLGNC